MIHQVSLNWSLDGRADILDLLFLYDFFTVFHVYDTII